MPIVERSPILVASDAAGSDRFGSGVAISADGLVLAVGARSWEGSLTDQGGVYIYDWTAGAWVQRGAVLTAADASSSALFGSDVALSSDGTVLAVGAYSAAAGNGAVYIYDWTAGAWVQRGAAITASDAGYGDEFGASVALSADAAILAVGAKHWEGAVGTDRGGVYIYDYTGGAWVQRGSVLEASDAADADYFGVGVALSDNGTILAVGAYYRDGAAGTNRGGVYIYDYTGGAWVQRGAVIEAADAADSDYFGSSVDLSGDGAILAVGATAWEGSTSNQGAVYLYDWTAGAWVQRAGLVTTTGTGGAFFGTSVALSATASVLVVGVLQGTDSVLYQGTVYVFDIVDSVTGTPVAPTTLTVEIATGTATGPTALTVEVATGTPAAPTALTVTWPTGAPAAQTRLTVTATGTPAAPTLLAVLGSAHAANWTARCVVGGVDVSAQLTGQASVTAAEGAARVAEVTLQPPPGAIAPLDYVGKTITLDYVLLVGGVEVPRRLFTGLIDTPSYDPNTTLLRLTCTDDLQNRVAALDRTVIDALVGGRYSTAVQGEHDDGWDYAQARLETVAGSLDAGPAGGMRVTPWQPAATWATFGEADLLYQRMRLSLPQRSRLVNRVDVAFSYRYNRLRQRFASTGWSGTQIDMAPCGYAYPTQQDVLGAAGGTGWTVTLGVFYPAPASIPHPSGGFIVPPTGSIDMAILRLTQRHSQTVTEGYTLTVTAPESVSANGELAHALRGALASEFSGSAWESALDVAPLFSADGEMDWAPDAPRADAEYAIQTLLDQANVKILGSHRSARVGNAVLCNPDLDVDKRVAIATPEVSAAGKVASVTHALDFSAGSAVSEFELAVFGAGGAGILSPDTLAPPADPSAAAADAEDWGPGVVALGVNVYGQTPYQDGLMGLLINPPQSITVENVPGQGTVSFDNAYYTAGSYPVTGFRMRMPGVADASRNPLDIPVASSYSVVIPVDTLTFTVPA